MLLKHLDHMLYGCADVSAARAFYELLGFRESWARDDGQWIHLFSGSTYLSLCSGPESGYEGYGHMGWEVADLASCREHLRVTNIPIRREVQTHEGSHIYIDDPDGFEIELVEYRDRPAYRPMTGQHFLRLDHMRFNVADLRASIRFYRDMLGGRITWSDVDGWNREGAVPADVDWVHVTFGDSYLSLGQADSNSNWGAGKPAPGPPRFIHSGWEVDNIDEVATQMDELHIAYGQPVQTDVGRHIYLNDAEGIVDHGTNLELTEYVATMPGVSASSWPAASLIDSLSERHGLSSKSASSPTTTRARYPPESSAGSPYTSPKKNP